MELITVRIPRKAFGDHDAIYIAPIGDIQWSGERGPTAQDTLKRHIERCMELKAWMIGMGDMTDFLSPSNRQRLAAANLYDTASDVVDDKAMELVHELDAKFLRPTHGRWLGLCEGHHFAQLRTGETTDQRLCQILKTTFLGTSAYVRLIFELSRTAMGTVVLWVHHGCGAGMTDASPLNRLKLMATHFEGADVYMMGHTTKSPATRMQKPYPVWNTPSGPKLVHREALLVNTGGFSRAYQVGATHGRTPRGGYAEQRMLPPSSIGAPIIEIRPFVREQGSSKNPGKRASWWAPEIKAII